MIRAIVSWLLVMLAMPFFYIWVGLFRLANKIDGKPPASMRDKKTGDWRNW